MYMNLYVRTDGFFLFCGKLERIGCSRRLTGGESSNSNQRVFGPRVGKTPYTAAARKSHTPSSSRGRSQTLKTLKVSAGLLLFLFLLVLLSPTASRFINIYVYIHTCVYIKTRRLSPPISPPSPLVLYTELYIYMCKLYVCV